MNSMILRVAAQWLLPTLLLISLLVFYRGHNHPGGGFIGGLLAASAFVLYAFAFGVEATRRQLRIDPHYLIAVGLLVAGTSMLPSLFYGLPPWTGIWTIELGKYVSFLKQGTPVWFDLGVYLTVIGVTLLIYFSLAEDSYVEDPTN
ncbi:MAG: Na+/H+ antiporter subunit B [Verrucomicrobiota bacterium]